MDIISILLVAAFGGMAPNLLDLGVSLTKGGQLPEWSYVIGLLIFGILGAGVAAVWKERNLKKAFYLGIGLPAFIQLSVNTVSQQEIAAVHFDKSSMFAMSSVALAQELGKPIPGRTLKVIPEKNTTQYKVIFSSPHGAKKKSLEINNTGEKTIKVPDFATTFAIQTGSSRSIEEKLSTIPGENTIAEIEVKKKVWSGFLKSIGVKNAPSETVKVRRVTE